MNVVIYKESLQKVEKFLEQLGVLKNKGKFDNEFSQELNKISKDFDVFELHNYITSNTEYSFLLNDDSIFQFSYCNDVLRFCFIQNPYKFIRIDEYAELIYEKDILDEFLNEISVYELYNVIQDDYEQYLETQKTISKFNYIRYDYNSLGYEPMLHSKSHLHIGTNNNLRIPISKYFTPLKFTKFCIKNTYYREWKEFFNKITDKQTFLNDIKNECQNLSSTDWCNDEKLEFYLS